MCLTRKCLFVTRRDPIFSLRKNPRRRLRKDGDVDSNRTLDPHPDPWLDLLRPYVHQVITALADGGVPIERSWLDPRDPRDATIVCAGVGLVWDEESGWRRGDFVAGHQGSRTVLTGAGYLGGEVLPAPAKLVRCLAGPAAPERPRYRSHTDVRDGLDETLGALRF
jgi:hypothetical protein